MEMMQRVARSKLQMHAVIYRKAMPGTVSGVGAALKAQTLWQNLQGGRPCLPAGTASSFLSFLLNGSVLLEQGNQRATVKCV